MKKTIAAIAALIALSTSAWAVSAEKSEKTDTYPLTTCVVSDEKLGEMGDPVIFNYEGREVRFCCKDCKKDFVKDPAKYLKILDDAAAKKKEGGAAVEKKTGHEGHNH